MTQSELRLHCPARTEHVKLVRHALAAFLLALEYDPDALEDVTTAAGEAIANAVEHAYGGAVGSGAGVELFARLQAGDLFVDVIDRGSFVAREPLPGRGFGLRIIRAIARHVSIDTEDGTRVRMTFGRCS